MKLKSYITISTFLLCSLPIGAQQVVSDTLRMTTDTLIVEEEEAKKAWEIGLGGTVFQFSRVGFSNFSQLDNGYQFDLDLNHAVWGGGIYAARELNKHFYLDLQGNFGVTNKSVDGKNKWMAMAGVGLQWRLGEYFKSRYVDPYLRAGINYMYKDFQILYSGSEGLEPDEMSWVLSNFGNKEGRDQKHLAPISLGGGINFWLSDRIGIGLQADYLLMPHKDVANSLQGSARLIWRIGGKSKKPRPVVRYVEKPVEKIVEKVVEKEVIVEKPVETVITKSLTELFDQIYFDFNSYEITSISNETLDKIAETFKRDTSRRFLITGQTDARGADNFNRALSEARAGEVVKALEERGVPSEMMKWRGIGKKIAIAPSSAPDNVRRGDRKITVELITNMDYWESIPRQIVD